MIYLARKWLYNPVLKCELDQQLQYLKDYSCRLKATVIEWEQAVKHTSAYCKNLDGDENIYHFFERHQLLFKLNEDIIFLIVCFFLTYFNIKNNNLPIAINLEKIAAEFSVSKYRAKRLMHRYQQIVCSLGSNFIMNIANDLILTPSYLELLPSLCKIADEDRTVLPCYVVSDIIFKHAIQETIPVLLRINRFTVNNPNAYEVLYFLLQGKEETMEFALKPYHNSLPEHCIVVYGEMYSSPDKKIESAENYIYRVLTENPLRLILANTAIHPQYSGKRLEAFRKNPFHAFLADCDNFNSSKSEIELTKLQQFALNTGCSKQNPSTFFLKHIYANGLLDEINRLKSINAVCAYNTLQIRSNQLLTKGHCYGSQEGEYFKSV